MDYSVSPSMHCKETASKVRQMLFMIRQLFAELYVSAFGATFIELYNMKSNIIGARWV